MPNKKENKKNGSKFPDLTGDGVVTQADILKGRGVFKMNPEVATIAKKAGTPSMKMDKKDY